jgi:hypothetical protein
MSKKKSYMDKDNIISEGFFKALIGLLLKPKITRILKDLDGDPELAKLTKRLAKQTKKDHAELRKKGMSPFWKKW